MKVSVVILNWNTKEYLKEFLPGVIGSCEGLGEAVVADSASSDGSIGMLADEYPSLKTIPLDRNYGFTGGYNRALKQLDSEYFVLLNSDIKVPDGWLKPLVDWMDSHPECGICAPKLHALRKDTSPDGQCRYVCSDDFEYAGAAGGYVDRFGYPFCRGRVMKRTETDSGRFDSIKDVLWVSGACLMVRRSIWESLGGLDDNFFAHMEEIDLCWRAHLCGWRVNVIPQSTVYHLGGGTLHPDSAFKLKLNYRNNLLLLKKNLPVSRGRMRAALIILTRMGLDLLSSMVYLLSGQKDKASAVLQAHREYRKLKNKVKPTEGAVMTNGEWLGMMRTNILLKYLTQGENIFKWMARYENNH